MIFSCLLVGFTVTYGADFNQLNKFDEAKNLFPVPTLKQFLKEKFQQTKLSDSQPCGFTRKIYFNVGSVSETAFLVLQHSTSVYKLLLPQ
jgi:hypothetical protein